MMQNKTHRIDGFIRIFHWSLVLLFVTAFITGDQNDGEEALHLFAGYVLTSLLLSRLLWGVIGSAQAKWQYYIHAPNKVLAYLRQLKQRPAFTLHNPAGSSMILLLLFTLLGTVLTGLLTQALFELSGPFVSLTATLNHELAVLIKDIHNVLSHLMLALIALHISGVLWSSYLYRLNLAKFMLTGKLKETL